MKSECGMAQPVEIKYAYDIVWDQSCFNEFNLWIVGCYDIIYAAKVDPKLAKLKYSFQNNFLNGCECRKSQKLFYNTVYILT